MPITAGNMAATSSLKNVAHLNNRFEMFSKILNEKKVALPTPNAPLTKLPALVSPMGHTASVFKKVLNNMVNNHEAALASIKEAMSNNDQSPEKLLNIQFKTGAFFLREQMFCKTAELFTNTLKNFTQMQV